MAKETALIDSLQQADVGIERAALGCVAAAGSLALELGLSGQQVARDFPRLRHPAMRHAAVALRPLAA